MHIWFIGSIYRDREHKELVKTHLNTGLLKDHHGYAPSLCVTDLLHLIITLTVLFRFVFFVIIAAYDLINVILPLWWKTGQSVVS